MSLGVVSRTYQARLPTIATFLVPFTYPCIQSATLWSRFGSTVRHILLSNFSQRMLTLQRWTTNRCPRGSEDLIRKQDKRQRYWLQNLQELPLRTEHHWELRCKETRKRMR